MTETAEDREFFDHLRKMLPMEPIPPEVSERIDRLVLAEVAALRASLAVQRAASSKPDTGAPANGRWSGRGFPHWTNRHMQLNQLAH